jgi:hypothetical protein
VPILQVSWASQLILVATERGCSLSIFSYQSEFPPGISEACNLFIYWAYNLT